MDNDPEQTVVSRAEWEEAYPEFVAEIAAEAIREERARIRHILTIAPMGQRALAFTLAFDEAYAPEAAALRFLEAEITQGGMSPCARGH